MTKANFLQLLSTGAGEAAEETTWVRLSTGSI